MAEHVPSVTVGTRNGKPVLRWWDGRIPRRQSCGTDDPVAIEMMRREKEIELRQGSSADTYEMHRDRPLKEHLDDYYQYLLHSGTSATQAKSVRTRVRRILEEGKLSTIRDLVPTRIKAAIANMTWKPQKRDVLQADWPKLSAQTRNFYLQAAKQFSRWLQVDRRSPDNPLVGLKGENVALDRRHDRRSLTDQEFVKLYQAARGSEAVVEGLTGEERARIYLVAFSTGLRRGEIGSLRKSSFQLDADSPTVTLEAAYSKHRRKDVLPLHRDFVKEVRKWLVGVEPKELLFPGLGRRKTFKFIQVDLKAAGIPYQDSNGKYADFHSLRHTFITRAWTSGATPDVIRALARHCDINLTLRYTHTTHAAQADAMQRLPSLPMAKD